MPGNKIVTESYTVSEDVHTLLVLIFAGINFREFHGFGQNSRKFIPAKNVILEHSAIVRQFLGFYSKM